MKWKKYTVDTTEEAVDFISASLSELGIEGIEIEDSAPLTAADTKGMFIDRLPDFGPDDGSARVSFYLDAKTHNISAMLRRVKDALEEIRLFADPGPLTIRESETEDKDWINNWKQYFRPFTVDDILIKPTWEMVPEEHKDKLMVQIDPGTAFGTGLHETTQLCIRALKKYVHGGEEILDVGTGSGILGITALLLGARHVLGTDLDENAIHAVGENLASNSLTEADFRVLQGDIISDRKVQEEAGFACYDIAAANILADVIIPLQREIPVHLKNGGIFITSGIIDIREDEVREALLSNERLELLETNRQNEWVSFVLRKK